MGEVTEKAKSVTGLGAFVEHQLWNPIYWNGDDGLLIMSQGECAYTNNGATDKSVAGDSTVQNKDLTPGVYYTVGSNVTKHTYLGGGIYNVFGERFTKTDKVAMEVKAPITKAINISKCMIAGWVDTMHFSGVLRYQGQIYGPAMLGASVSFYLCDLQKLLGAAPTPSPPTPARCKGVKCVISDADYYGNLPGWPRGQENQQYNTHMDPGQCCNVCKADPSCRYWKEANHNCFYYTSNSSIPQKSWANFTGSHPQSIWNVGLRDDECCACTGGSNVDVCGHQSIGIGPIKLAGEAILI